LIEALQEIRKNSSETTYYN